jgi:hypothetical protein
MAPRKQQFEKTVEKKMRVSFVVEDAMRNFEEGVDLTDKEAMHTLENEVRARRV